jgi:HNH endonuclease
VRDGKRCQFPGCTHTRHLHAHHVRHWLFGGRTDIDNLILVCSFHHVRHEALIVPNGGETTPSAACRSRSLKLRAA